MLLIQDAFLTARSDEKKIGNTNFHSYNLIYIEENKMKYIKWVKNVRTVFVSRRQQVA